MDLYQARTYIGSKSNSLCQKNYYQIIKNSDMLILNLKSGKSIIHLYCFVYEILNALRDSTENINV